MNEPKFQLSEKVSYGGILVVRGENADEFAANLLEAAQSKELGHALRTFIDEAQSFAQISNSVGNVKEQMPGTRTLAAVPDSTPPQQTTAGTFQCPHGQRVHRTGTSAKGHWEAYFCPVKAQECKPMGADGKLWR